MLVDSENIARIRMLGIEYNLSLGELAQTIDENPTTLEAINASEKPLTKPILGEISMKYGIRFRGIAKRYQEHPEHELILEV